jgi:transcriptional regulator with XRE-family HTH domain
MMALDRMDAEIGAKLRGAREKAGLRQGAVARLLSRPAPMVSEWESGKRPLPAALYAPEKLALWGVDAAGVKEIAALREKRARAKAAANGAQLTREQITYVITRARDGGMWRMAEIMASVRGGTIAENLALVLAEDLAQYEAGPSEGGAAAKAGAAETKKPGQG